DRRVAVVVGDVAQDRDAVAIGEPHVGEAEVIGTRLERGLRLLEGGSGIGIHAHARKREHEELANVRLVVHDQNGLAVHQVPFTVMRKWPPPESSTYSMRAPLPSQS